MEMKKLAMEGGNGSQTTASRQPELSEQKEDIQILSTLTFDLPYETAIIDPHSPCNTITLQKLTDLRGPQVQYTKADSENPHQHHGLVGTIRLRLESDESGRGKILDFCILTHESRPIVLNMSMKPTNRQPQALPMGIAVVKKDDKQSKKEAHAKWKARQAQISKDKDKNKEDKKDEEARQQLNEAAQGK